MLMICRRFSSSRFGIESISVFHRSARGRKVLETRVAMENPYLKAYAKGSEPKELIRTEVRRTGAMELVGTVGKGRISFERL